MTLLEVYSQVIQVKDAIANGEYLKALQLSLPLVQYILDAAQGLKNAGPGDDAVKAQIKAACEEAIADHGNTVGAVGAWGDGSVLKLVLQVLQTLLPLLV